MNRETNTSPVEKPIQFPEPLFGSGQELVDVNRLIKAGDARRDFNVNGHGLCAAVLDTGLNTRHVDFAGRILAQKNFTNDNNGDENDATDGNGHGTNVGGIIVAGDDHTGIAPGGGIIPLKVLADNGNGSFDAIDKALQWVLENQQAHDISVVCMSLGGSQNFQEDDSLSGDSIQKKIQALRDKRVAVTIAAGNDFFVHESREGMSYPAIIRECISVGAVYDEDEGSFQYSSGAVARSTGEDRITPFSQRLHPTTNRHTFTDIFAPGAPVTSSGINGPHGESIQHGTSQATPVVCGVILLMQELFQRAEGSLPGVDDLVGWMRQSGTTINDGDDENDNVNNTGKDFIRVDALEALRKMRRSVEVGRLLREGVVRLPD